MAVARKAQFQADGRNGVGADLAATVKPAPFTKGTAGPGRVLFQTAQPPMQVVCKLGAESATPGGGAGGWSALELPGREDAVEWGSTPGRTLSVPILLDGLVRRLSIETALEMLYLMGRPEEHAPRGSTPPVVRVGGMVPGTDRDWVLNGIDEGEAVWDGYRRIRLFATVNLMEYRLAELVVVRRKRKSSGTTRVYTVRRGDSLGSIAKDEMGAKTASQVARAVAALKRLNKIRDPKSIRPGQRLKLPRR